MILFTDSLISGSLPLEEALTDPARATVLEHAIQLIEARTGVLLPLGRNPKIRVIRLTLGPFPEFYMSLASQSVPD